MYIAITFEMRRTKWDKLEKSEFLTNIWSIVLEVLSSCAIQSDSISQFLFLSSEYSSELLLSFCPCPKQHPQPDPTSMYAPLTSLLQLQMLTYMPPSSLLSSLSSLLNSFSWPLLLPLLPLCIPFHLFHCFHDILLIFFKGLFLFSQLCIWSSTIIPFIKVSRCNGTMEMLFWCTPKQIRPSLVRLKSFYHKKRLKICLCILVFWVSKIIST